MTWSNAMVARLKALHADGKSSSVIARSMTRDFRGAITRGAVCGKAWRLGLRRRKAT